MSKKRPKVPVLFWRRLQERDGNPVATAQSREAAKALPPHSPPRGAPPITGLPRVLGVNLTRTLVERMERARGPEAVLGLLADAIDDRH